jgi:dimethylaniline monooxygenase (N-oxide forming)
MDRSKTKIAIVGGGKSHKAIGTTDPTERRTLILDLPGVAGMAALKELRELGFDVTLFERRRDVGGVWSWSDDLGMTTALKQTHVCNSKWAVSKAPILASFFLFFLLAFFLFFFFQLSYTNVCGNSCL